MSVMPMKLRESISADPEYTRCALLNVRKEVIGDCAGRITREHALYFASNKVQERYAIPPICAKHHGVDQYMDAGTAAPKEMRVWVALNRATDAELLSISKSENYLRKREVLNRKYGEYVPPPVSAPMKYGV